MDGDGGAGSRRDERLAGLGMILFAASVVAPGLALTILFGFGGLFLIGRLSEPGAGRGIRSTVLLGSCCLAANLAAGRRFRPRSTEVGDVLPLDVVLLSAVETLGGVVLVTLLAFALQRWSRVRSLWWGRAWRAVSVALVVGATCVLTWEVLALAFPAWQDRIELAQMVPASAPPFARAFAVFGEIAAGVALLAFLGTMVLMAVRLLGPGINGGAGPSSQPASA